MDRHTRVITGILLFTLLVAACSSGATSKAGGPAPPLVLKIGTNDYPGRPAADQIEDFAARVAEISDGQIQIEPVWQVGGRDTTNWDQIVARQVISGELEMGNIPTRAWDTEGVATLRALNAPFLITTDPLLDEVVSSDLADALLSGLDDVGVVGLGLLPDGLRHPFGFSAPLLGLEDYEGATIRAPASATTQALFAALGAAVVDGPIDDATQSGMESGYAYDPLGVGTGNVVFYPKVNALVVNADVFERMTDDERAILEQAAAETQWWASQSRATDTDLAGRFCESGGTVVVADEATLTALEDATQAVYSELEADPQTKEIITAIRELKKSLTVEELVIPDGCTGEPTSREADAEGTDDPSIINGTYRLEWNADELFDALMRSVPPDVPPNDVPLELFRSDAERNAGVVTITFEDGRYDQLLAGENCPGTYTISDNRIIMVATSDPAEWECGTDSLGRKGVHAAWELTDQGLLLSDFILSEQPDITWWNAIYLSKPLTRVD